jgi:thiosulfate/3-mercaptopyruvate sulfurtransferase
LVITKFHKPIVSVEWLHDNINATNLIILDASIPKVSESNDITNELCIPNAKFFDLKNKFSDTTAPFPTTFPTEDQFEKEAQNIGINTDSFIVVYDDKGIYSSPRVWWLFKAFGFNNIAVLDGGLPTWIEAYYPLAKKESYADAKGDFKARLQSGFMTFFNDMKALSEGNSCNILDARSRDRFNGIQAEPREGLRSGTIPNSKNLPFETLLDNGKMRSENEILTFFQNEVTNQKPVIFSCGSGITACVLALGATLVGYNSISVYDGSWTEWGTLMPE